jgi:DNA-binding PucR family transcriptional regulator
MGRVPAMAEHGAHALLADRGQLIPAGYDLDSSWHLGLVGTGLGAEKVIEDLGRKLGRRVWSVMIGAATAWAWLSSPQPLGSMAVQAALDGLPAEIYLACGEPGAGIGGWRHTHRQAREAQMIARHTSAGFTRYADVLLLAALYPSAKTLSRLYLTPLERTGIDVSALRATLDAYFATGFSVTSTASKLNVHRNTVRDRLDAVEAALGRPLHSCIAELIVALRLESLLSRPSAGERST